jgi:hypothetical protein
MFRAALGVGSMLSPLLGSVSYKAGGFTAAFLTVGVTFIMVQPFIYCSLVKSKTEFEKINQNQQEECEVLLEKT